MTRKEFHLVCRHARYIRLELKWGSYPGGGDLLSPILSFHPPLFHAIKLRAIACSRIIRKVKRGESHSWSTKKILLAPVLRERRGKEVKVRKWVSKGVCFEEIFSLCRRRRFKPIPSKKGEREGGRRRRKGRRNERGFCHSHFLDFPAKRRRKLITLLENGGAQLFLFFSKSRPFSSSLL